MLATDLPTMTFSDQAHAVLAVSENLQADAEELVNRVQLSGIQEADDRLQEIFDVMCGARCLLRCLVRDMEVGNV